MLILLGTQFIEHSCLVTSNHVVVNKNIIDFQNVLIKHVDGIRLKFNGYKYLQYMQFILESSSIPQILHFKVVCRFSISRLTYFRDFIISRSLCSSTAWPSDADSFPKYIIKFVKMNFVDCGHLHRQEKIFAIIINALCDIRPSTVIPSIQEISLSLSVRVVVHRVRVIVYRTETVMKKSTMDGCYFCFVRLISVQLLIGCAYQLLPSRHPKVALLSIPFNC